MTKFYFLIKSVQSYSTVQSKNMYYFGKCKISIFFCKSLMIAYYILMEIDLQVLKLILSKRKSINMNAARQKLSSKNKLKYKAHTNLMILAKNINQRKQDNSAYKQSWIWGQYKFFLWAAIHYAETRALDMNQMHMQEEFKVILNLFPDKEQSFLMFQYILAFSEKNGCQWNWSPEEIQIFQGQGQKVKLNQWKEISYEIYKASNGKYFKDPQSCRNRWTNHSNPEINKRSWTLDEDILLINHIMNFGRRWSKIAKLIHNGRTEHMLKNRFRFFIRKFGLKEQKELNQICQQIIYKIGGIKIEADQDHQQYITNDSERMKRYNIPPKTNDNAQVVKEFLQNKKLQMVKQEQLNESYEMIKQQYSA